MPSVTLPKAACWIADEAVAGGQGTVCGDPEIAGACPAGIGPVGAAMQLAHGGDRVGERVRAHRAITRRSNSAPQATISLQHGGQLGPAQLVAAGR